MRAVLYICLLWVALLRPGFAAAPAMSAALDGPTVVTGGANDGSAGADRRSSFYEDSEQADDDQLAEPAASGDDDCLIESTTRAPGLDLRGRRVDQASLHARRLQLICRLDRPPRR